MILTHKSNGSKYIQVAFKWQGIKRYFSFGMMNNGTLSAAKNYLALIDKIRQEHKEKNLPLPPDPPIPQKSPYRSINSLIAHHQKLTQDDYLPMDIVFILTERSRAQGLTPDQHLEVIENYTMKYRQWLAEQAAKRAVAVAKRQEALAKKAKSKEQMLSLG